MCVRGSVRVPTCVIHVCPRHVRRDLGSELPASPLSCCKDHQEAMPGHKGSKGVRGVGGQPSRLLLKVPSGGSVPAPTCSRMPQPPRPVPTVILRLYSKLLKLTYI